MTTTSVKIHGVDSSKINPTQGVTSWGVGNVQIVARSENKLTEQANELLRKLNREVFNNSIDMAKLPDAVGWLIDFARNQVLSA